MYRVLKTTTNNIISATNLKDVDNKGKDVAEEEDNHNTQQHHSQTQLPLFIPIK